VAELLRQSSWTRSFRLAVGSPLGCSRGAASGATPSGNAWLEQGNEAGFKGERQGGLRRERCHSFWQRLVQGNKTAKVKIKGGRKGRGSALEVKDATPSGNAWSKQRNKAGFKGERQEGSALEVGGATPYGNAWSKQRNETTEAGFKEEIKGGSALEVKGATPSGNICSKQRNKTAEAGV